ncbi:nucleoporin-like protein 2 [Rhinatrema bivittatum]|uniref:nucleoporin-like protein 2 n=1 Tax=Rhinatrema bivittatum TaxID=194408 RepID=UPI00112E94C2|nr:nucleoporin-like protein 2 [Rhinatrema bivittatum]
MPRAKMAVERDFRIGLGGRACASAARCLDQRWPPSVTSSTGARSWAYCKCCHGERMTVCNFYLQGRCRYGERCWNEHPRGGRSQPAQGGSRGGWGGQSQRYTHIIQPSSLNKSTSWSSNRESGRSSFGSYSRSRAQDSENGASGPSFSQNRFSALSSSHETADNLKDDDQKLIDVIIKDIEAWESSGQWMFSAYSVAKDKHNLSGFSDFSPEELRLEYYKCRTDGNLHNYVNSIQQLGTQWKNQILKLKHLDSSSRAALMLELQHSSSGAAPNFEFGVQQTLKFGSSSFPTNNNTNSSNINSFSFKPSTGLLDTSGASTAVFGSSVTPSSTFDTLAASGAPRSAGFANGAAPSAASFRFSSAPVSTFGGPALSSVGIGNSASAPTPPTGFGTLSSSSGPSPFGQAHGFSVHPAAATSSMAEPLFTPQHELSAEELQQFKAKRFTLGRIPLKPPPADLLIV